MNSHMNRITVKCGRCGMSETYERPVGGLGRPPKYCAKHRAKPHVSVNLRNAWIAVTP